MSKTFNETKQSIQGYKGFKVVNNEFYCNNFHYEIGKIYQMSSDIEICKKGFHFCDDIRNVLRCYPGHYQDNIFCSILAQETIKNDSAKYKYCCSKIQINNPLEGNIQGCYFTKGKLNRKDGPAIIYDDGTEEWYKDGMLHRDDGPAIITTVSKYWYKNNKLDRDIYPAIMSSNGTKEYYKDGKRHRDDGPAIEDCPYRGNLYYIIGEPIQSPIFK